MLQAEFIAQALAGKPVVLVEYRSFKQEEIRYRDKKTGAAVERQIVKHAVEMGGAQVQISEWLPEGTKPGTAQPPFKKGHMAVLEIHGMRAEQGFYRAEGNLFPYEAEAAKK
jgi:hypothetical protein